MNLSLCIMPSLIYVTILTCILYIAEMTHCAAAVNIECWLQLHLSKWSLLWWMEHYYLKAVLLFWLTDWCFFFLLQEESIASQQESHKKASIVIVIMVLATIAIVIVVLTVYGRKYRARWVRFFFVFFFKGSLQFVGSWFWCSCLVLFFMKFGDTLICV